MPTDSDNWLVSTEWLNTNLHHESIRVLDVTAMLTKDLENIARERVYEQGHIPGAVFLDVGSGKGPLADPGAALPCSRTQRQPPKNVELSFTGGEVCRVCWDDRLNRHCFADDLSDDVISQKLPFS